MLFISGLEARSGLGSEAALEAKRPWKRSGLVQTKPELNQGRSMVGRTHDIKLVVRWGCAAGLVLCLMGLVIIPAIWLFSYERYVTQYPNSTPMPAYTNYTAQPFYIYLANAYRTSDRPSQIHNWYVDHLDLTIILDEEECVTLEGVKRHLGIIRTTTVQVCEGGQGQQTIYMTRSNSLR